MIRPIFSSQLIKILKGRGLLTRNFDIKSFKKLANVEIGAIKGFTRDTITTIYWVIFQKKCGLLTSSHAFCSVDQSEYIAACFRFAIWRHTCGILIALV